MLSETRITADNSKASLILNEILGESHRQNGEKGGIHQIELLFDGK